MRLYFPFLAGLILCSLVCAGLPEAQGSKIESFERYCAGIAYLDAAATFSVREKYAYYARLVALTGFNAEEARKYSKKFGNDPHTWNEIMDAVLKLIENAPKAKE
jgi:hypothetical protein